MNLFSLFMLFAIAAAAVLGIILIANQNNTPYVDSYNNTPNNSINASQRIVGNVTATGSQVGGAVVFLVGCLITVVIIVAIAFGGSYYGKGRGF